MNLPKAVIREHEYVVVESKEEANNVASAVLNWLNEEVSSIHGEGTEFIGVAMEWNAFGSDSSSQSLQVSFRDHPTYFFNLSKMEVKKPDDFPGPLRELLSDIRLRSCGRNIGMDLARLSDLGVNVKHRLELGQLGQLLKPGEASGLADLARIHLGVFVDKSLRLDDWSQYPTPVPMIVYACLDAKLSRVLAGVMF